MHNYIRSIVTAVLMVVGLNIAYGQQGKEIVGVVIDKSNGERLSFVNVNVQGRKKGVLTDDNGVFKIRLNKGEKLVVRSMGFAELQIEPKREKDTLRLALKPESTTLSEVVVNPKKEKYSKKNNPAVRLMQSVRDAKSKLDPREVDYYSYNRYDKTTMGIHNYKSDLNSSNKEGSKNSITTDYVDTAYWSGKRILKLVLKEKSANVYTGSKRGSTEERLLGQRSEGIDEMIGEDMVRTFLEDVLREINLYDNDIALMQQRFVSPLSNIAADYYKYEIVDTVEINGERCAELSFTPHTPESFGFNGKLYIPIGGKYKYIRRATMRLPKAANINYVNNIYIQEDFELDPRGYVNKISDDVAVEIQILPNSAELFATRSSRYQDFSPQEINLPLKKLEDDMIIAETPISERSNDFWDRSRLISLSSAESRMESMMPTFRKNKIFYWGEQIALVLIKGYVKTGKKSLFDLGPANTLLSYNTAEGLRMRIGGMTTANLNDRLFARGYIAYGFRDHKIKYNSELEYSFLDKEYHSREFPIHSIRGTLRYDIDQLGQHYLFTNADNVFLSFKRMESNLITYERLAKLEYTLEKHNGFSINAEIKNARQEASQWVPFIRKDGSAVAAYQTNSAKITLRYAPGEKYVQTATSRTNVNMDAPVFMLTQEFGPKSLLGSDFEICKTEVSAKKRIWFSAFGMTDIVLKGGYIWSQVQFPALLWQNANISYTIQNESYALLNPMEFAMDRYASWDMTYFGNGVLFNRLPLIKKMKLREVASFKGFVGRLSDKNNPALNDNLFRFPIGAKTEPMGKEPYMEVSAGLDNIFTILRVEYIWRLSYRNRPGVDDSGLRIALHFSF